MTDFVFDEFLITKKGKPLLFILGSYGPTWIDEEEGFNRPLERLRGLELWENGSLLMADAIHVARVLGWHRKRLAKRLRKLEEKTGRKASLSSVVLTCPWEEAA